MPIQSSRNVQMLLCPRWRGDDRAPGFERGQSGCD